MTMSPARSVVFGIARRVPPPDTPQKSLNKRIVSDPAKYIPHTTVERIIFPQIKYADIFWQHDIMPWLGDYSNRFSLTSPAHNARQFLDTSCQSRDRVTLIMGLSSIWAWVSQPCLGLLDFRQVPNGH